MWRFSFLVLVSALYFYIYSCSAVEASCYANGRVECCTKCSRAPGTNDNINWKPENESNPMQSVSLDGNTLSVFPTGYYMEEVYCYLVNIYSEKEDTRHTIHTICPNHERLSIKDLSEVFSIEVELRTSASHGSVCFPSCGTCGRKPCGTRKFLLTESSTLAPKKKEHQDAVAALSAILTVLFIVIAVGVFVFLWRKRTKHRPDFCSRQEMRSSTTTHTVASTEPPIPRLRSVSERDSTADCGTVNDTRQNTDCSVCAMAAFPTNSPSLCASEPDGDISDIIGRWDNSYCHAHFTTEDSHDA